jgi:ERF superfamily
MQRSSESIAKLAAALAKAQPELINPEKSLVGSIRSDGPSGAERPFRYAPLSSGLDIVRKTLGEHEIAVMQTTAIDQTAGIVKLTTMLAHSSGEWIASDWPVCATSETTTPHRMGAALTYARRYALFTLVGIAGEDDLDAPDLQPPAGPAPGLHKQSCNGPANGGSAPGRLDGARRPAPGKPILGAEESIQLGERLLLEITELQSGEDATLWAHRSLAQKNRLNAGDAKRVEAAFQAKLAAQGDAVIEDAAPAPGRRKAPVRSLMPGTAPAKKRRRRDERIDKSLLALPEPRRVRDREHVRFVATQPCLICGREPADAHHVRFAQNPALGRKVSDEFTVPLCRGHHRELHRCGDEPVWWLKVRINLLLKARALWLKTHPLPRIGQNITVEGTTSVASAAPDRW